jgi:hypothetical protein
VAIFGKIDFFVFFEKVVVLLEYSSSTLFVLQLSLMCSTLRPEKRKNSQKKFENHSIFATFMYLNHVLKIVGRPSSGNLFSI